MKHRLAAAAVPVAWAAATAVFGIAFAGANPDPQPTDPQDGYCPAMMFQNHGYCDPHIPDPFRDHCFGGRTGSMMHGGNCDGAPYPDGSYWRVTQRGVSTVENPKGWMSLGKQCVIGDGSQPAPPGGCGGAV